MRRAIRNNSVRVWVLLLLWPAGLSFSQNPQIAPSRDPTNITLLESVQSALLNHPLLRLQEAQVQISRGVQEQASGQFDILTQSSLSQNRLDTPLTVFQRQQNGDLSFANSQAFNITSYSVGASKEFRNGITVGPNFQLNRTTDNLFMTHGVNTSLLSLVINVPLLRGRGRKVVAAQEDAAREEVSASVFDLNQLISQLVLNAASSYWNLVAASKNLAIATDAETRGKVYLDNVQELVKADHVPRNDLSVVRANLSERSSNRMAAEQQLVAMQQQLSLDVGLSMDRIAGSVLEPVDDFPDGEEQQMPSGSTASLQYYVDQALLHRADYLASQKRVTEAGISLNAAKNELQPQVNLSLAAGYAGLQEGRRIDQLLSSTYVGIPGPQGSVGITYSFPVGNRSAHGLLTQADAFSREADLKQRELGRNISAAVVVAAEGVRNGIARLKNAREAVESFSKALAGERDKYRGGIGSIVDILTIEDRLTSALSDQVTAQLAFAQALIQFRFATGTLVSPDRTLQNIRADTFRSLPFAGTLDEKRP
jgi:outer membrane protein